MRLRLASALFTVHAFRADYYALRAGALDSVVAMAQPDSGARPRGDWSSHSARYFSWPSPASPLRGWTAGGGGVAPVLLPNCSFSRALALWRASLVASGQQIPLPLGGSSARHRGSEGLDDPDVEPPSSSDGSLGEWIGLAARRATRQAGLEVRGGGQDDAFAADSAVASAMAASICAFCATPTDPASSGRAARLGVAAQLFAGPSAWSPIGAAARAVLLHPTAVLALLRELEVSAADTGTAHFGTDTRRGMGTDDADAAAMEPPPEGVVLAGSEPEAPAASDSAGVTPKPMAVATSVHTVAWQALGRPDVDGCVWAELFSHPFFALAEREQEASEASGQGADLGAADAARLDPRMGRLVRVFVTRQSALWKDSDALAMLHRASLAAAAAWEAATLDMPATSSSEPAASTAPVVRSEWLTDSAKREALLKAAFGSNAHAAVCVALADAARTAAYVVGSAALEAPPVPAAATPGVAVSWETVPPLAHYAGAIRAEFSDEVKEVSDDELRAAAGADLPVTGAAAGDGAAEARADLLGSRLQELAGQGARLQIGGPGGQLVDVDELLSRAAALGMTPEELMTAMQTAHLLQAGSAGAEDSGALPVDTDPIAAFFQSLLPWVSAPTPPGGVGQPAELSSEGHSAGEPPRAASPIIAPMSDADIAAQLQAAEDYGYFDVAADGEDASTDDEA